MDNISEPQRTFIDYALFAIYATSMLVIVLSLLISVNLTLYMWESFVLPVIAGLLANMGAVGVALYLYRKQKNDDIIRTNAILVGELYDQFEHLDNIKNSIMENTFLLTHFFLLNSDGIAGLLQKSAIDVGIRRRLSKLRYGIDAFKKRHYVSTPYEIYGPVHSFIKHSDIFNKECDDLHNECLELFLEINADKKYGDYAIRYRLISNSDVASAKAKAHDAKIKSGYQPRNSDVGVDS